jgi:hypothetical protein
MLKRNATLLSLDLRDNQIGAASAKDLSDMLKQNISLTSLHLSTNQIGDAGAKALSDVLKYNSTLISLDLYNNQINASGAKDLSDMLKQTTTLISLELRYNQIDNKQHKQINALIQRNEKMMLARRQQFFFKIIMLARNARNPNPDSLWANLPKEIKLHVLSYLYLASESYIGKIAKQTGQCIQFIFTHIDECNVLIKDKQKIKLMEKEAINGNYQFQLFKSSAYHQAKKQGKISIQKQTDLAECKRLNSADTDVILNQFK